MASVITTWHQVVKTVVQPALNSKWISTSSDGTIISAINGHP
jgi:hypothetical protein